MKLGKFQLHLLCDGTFRLDGGAMFGVVPKTIWQKIHPADEKNCIKLGINQLLIQTPEGQNILVNTGIGGKFDAKFSSIFAIERPQTLLDALTKLHLTPSDIHVVIATHLHFDHNGGSTYYDENGDLQLTFPQAEYIVQQLEWEDATHPHERNRASYLPENIEPLRRVRKLTLIDGDTEIFPGIEVRRTGGHTRGHQIVLIRSEGETAVFWSDLIPTSGHTHIPLVMGYDLFPVETIQSKKKLLQEAVEENWLCFWEHETELRAGRIRLGKKGYFGEMVELDLTH